MPIRKPIKIDPKAEIISAARHCVSAMTIAAFQQAKGSYQVASRQRYIAEQFSRYAFKMAGRLPNG